MIKPSHNFSSLLFKEFAAVYYLLQFVYIHAPAPENTAIVAFRHWEHIRGKGIYGLFRRAKPGCFVAFVP